MRKLAFIVFLGSVILTMNCGGGLTHLGWDRAEFEKWNAQEGDKTFQLKHISTEINFAAEGIHEVHYDSKSYVDALPFHEIAGLLEKRYNVKIDTTYFEEAKKNGNLVFSLTIDKTKKVGTWRVAYETAKNYSILKKTTSDAEYTFHHDPEHILVWIKSNWQYLVWQEDKRWHSRGYDLEGANGTGPHLSIVYYLNWIDGFSVEIRLCVPQGEKDKDGFYKLAIGAKHRLHLGKEPTSLDEMIKQVQSIPTLLERELFPK
jgi:hypothetical protein